MKRIAGLILIVMLFLPFKSNAQQWKLRRYEANFGLALNNFYGDVGTPIPPGKFLGSLGTYNPVATRPSFDFGVRYKLNGAMSVKMDLLFGFIAAKDAGNLVDRGYAFRTTIFEPTFKFEYYLIPEGRSFSTAALFNRRGMVNNYSKVNAYLFGGVGGALTHPKGLNGLENDVRFQNLTNFGVVFPAGAGIKIALDALWSFGFEYGRRFTLTDKIDGLETATSSSNDMYEFATFSAIYKVRTDRRGRPIFRGGFVR
ncbi:MAG: hypothetical protein K9H49_10360 [Bacteroidales bacterium]|nr:hypothetical protein [Bacteroidales bacterium]MCF8389705.1 hypothetical protein [Bacteroidales bacterium]